MISKETEGLINKLCNEVDACCPLAHPALRILPWAIFTFLYTGLVLFIIGVRDDISEKLGESVFLFETGLAAFISISAALASSWLSVPDMRGKTWLPAVPLTGAAVFLFWTVINFFLHTNAPDIGLTDIHWDHCLEGGALFGALPAAVLIWMMRKGATTMPILMWGMNILSVASLAYIAMRLACGVDHAAHAGAVQILPFILIGFLIGAFSRKLYRW